MLRILFIILVMASCRTNRMPTNYAQKKENLKHDQKIGLIGLPILFIYIYFIDIR